MKFRTIEDVINAVPMNVKAAECLGKAGAFLNLEDDLNELESSKYAKKLVQYKREERVYQSQIEKYELLLLGKKQVHYEKVQERKRKQDIRDSKYQERLSKFTKRLEEVRTKNQQREKEGKKLLVIPVAPKEPRPLKEIPDFEPPQKPQIISRPSKPRIVLSPRERVKLQKEMLNIYISGHPLDDVKENVKAVNICDLENYDQNSWCTLQGVLQSIKIINTRKKTLIGKLNIEDKTGTVEVVLFSKVYEPLKGLLEPEEIYEILGRVDVKKIEHDSGTEHTYVQVIGTKVKKVAIGADNEWAINYPLLKGELCILPGVRQKSMDRAIGVIKNTPRKKIGELIELLRNGNKVL
jgi:DNA polymerase III alpha subunit